MVELPVTQLAPSLQCLTLKWGGWMDTLAGLKIVPVFKGEWTSSRRGLNGHLSNSGVGIPLRYMRPSIANSYGIPCTRVPSQMYWLCFSSDQKWFGAREALDKWQNQTKQLLNVLGATFHIGPEMIWKSQALSFITDACQQHLHLCIFHLFVYSLTYFMY